jgi:hypothetical protein
MGNTQGGKSANYHHNRPYTLHEHLVNQNLFKKMEFPIQNAQEAAAAVLAQGHHHQA